MQYFHLTFLLTSVYTPYGVNFPYKYNHFPQIFVIDLPSTSFLSLQRSSLIIKICTITKSEKLADR